MSGEDDDGDQLKTPKKRSDKKRESSKTPLEADVDDKKKSSPRKSSLLKSPKTPKAIKRESVKEKLSSPLLNSPGDGVNKKAKKKKEKSDGSTDEAPKTPKTPKTPKLKSPKGQSTKKTKSSQAADHIGPLPVEDGVQEAENGSKVKAKRKASKKKKIDDNDEVALFSPFQSTSKKMSSSKRKSSKLKSSNDIQQAVESLDLNDNDKSPRSKSPASVKKTIKAKSRKSLKGVDTGGDSTKDKKKLTKKKSKSEEEDIGKQPKKRSTTRLSQLILETICCVCKDSSSPVAGYGNCEHVFCKPCLERVLYQPFKNPQIEDNHLIAPTLGRCPRCDEELRLFEVKDVTTNKPLYSKQNENILDTPLAGLVFCPADSDAHVGNLHFDVTDLEPRPYFDFASAIAKDPEAWRLDDGEEIPDKKYFFDSHYHEPTKSFHGSIFWNGSRFQGAYRWDCIFAFKGDFSAMKVGLIHMRKERIIEEDIYSIDADERYRHLFPCDGNWTLIYEKDGEEKRGQVIVHGNQFRQGPYTFSLNFSNPKEVGFKWPLDPVFATSVSGIDLTTRPMGPEVGDQIVWKTTHHLYEEIIWERVDVTESTFRSTQHFGLEGDIQMVEENHSDAMQELDEMKKAEGEGFHDDDDDDDDDETSQYSDLKGGIDPPDGSSENKDDEEEDEASEMEDSADGDGLPSYDLWSDYHDSGESLDLNPELKNF